MFSFFRRIRRNLANDNQFLKYSRYAIGETVLVVIGILIAIQLNSIKQDKDKRIEEVNHLKNILSDLNKDKVDLEQIIERRISKANSAKTMESYYHTHTVENLSDYYSNWTNVLYWEAHNPSYITFKELINSGKLSSLSNESIKQLLLTIDYSYNELFELRKHMYDDYSNYLYIPFSDIVDYENAIITWSEPNANIDLSREDVEKALKDRRIKNGFTLASFNNDILGKLSTEILIKVDSTIILVENEIDK